MFVIGIDPGLSATGYGIVEAAGGRTRAVAAGVLRTPPSTPLPQRLAELHADLGALLAEFDPDEAALETVFTNNNLRTSIAVGRASGVALLALAQAGLEVFEYAPTAVKHAVTGSGTADKEQVQRVVSRRLGLGAAPPADAADALAIALCHLQTTPLRRAVERAR